jgi:hypothetical protein
LEQRALTYQKHAEDLNSRAKKTAKNARIFRRSEDIAVNKLPASFFDGFIKLLFEVLAIVCSNISPKKNLKRFLNTRSPESSDNNHRQNS